jgi:hypothetical protein
MHMENVSRISTPSSRKDIVMKRVITGLVVLAFSTAALAQAPENRWRSPFTGAPALGGVSPLDAERNHKAMVQDQAAWAARRQAVAATRTDRATPVAEHAAFLTSPKQLGRTARATGR